MLDGRRLWLVSGTVPYARLCRDSWKDRIHAAKAAGLNTVETPIFWNRHEPRPGRFDFTGENDLRYFVELVQAAGLYCALRIGPYVGDGWDMGGLPPWLLEGKPLVLRSASGPYLEACSRFITAVCDEIRDLQVTSPGKGGPIVYVQCENNWTCGLDQLAAEYLGELNRYLREGGVTVPLMSSNNLWQTVEGQIDAWSGPCDLLATMRQLAAVRPQQPRLVIDFAVERTRCWGREDLPAERPEATQRKLAEILAGGGQFNLRNFAAGSNMAFWGGRAADGQDFFASGSDLAHPVVAESGRRGGSFSAIRRICHFASRFGRIFANLDPTYRPVSIDPAAGSTRHPPGGKRAKAPVGAGLSVVSAVGSQGYVAFVFADETEDGGAEPVRSTSLLLPDGSTLPVSLGKQHVAWCIFDAYLGGRAKVDYCNFNAFASLGQVFVGYAPAGSRALLSVNGSPIEVAIPTGRAPLVVEHEGLTVVLVSEDEVDSVHLSDASVFVGVAGVTSDGTPIASPDDRHYMRIDADGKVKKMTAEATKPASAEKVSLANWSMASMSEYEDGSSPRYAAISGPADLTALGCSQGYGWYRLPIKPGTAHKVHLAFPQAADRLHLFVDGQPGAIVGVGPGSARDAVVTLKKSQQTLVILAENLGRFSEGAHLGERKGLYGHVWEHEPLKVAKAKVVRGSPIDILAFKSPLWDTREGDSTLPDRITWTLTHKKKTPVFVWFRGFPVRSLLLLNDQPLAYVDPAGPACITLESEQLAKANSTLQVAVFGDGLHAVDPEAIAESVTFSEGVAPISAKGEFAFAKWEPPVPSMFAAASKGAAKPGHPAWWKCTFKLGASRSPLYFEPSGLTKGQIYLNGHHLGRYFVATADGKSVPPQSRYLLPDPWLRHGRDNEIVLFDEHGAHPGKTSAAYEPEGQDIIRA